MAIFKHQFFAYDSASKSTKLTTATSVTATVIRDDTEAEVLTDVVMEEESTGQYFYGFTDEAINLSYTPTITTIWDSITYTTVLNTVYGASYISDVYATVADFKTYIDYTSNGYTDTDAELLAMLTHSSRLVDAYCNRTFYGTKDFDTIPELVERAVFMISKRLKEVPDGEVEVASESIGDYSYTKAETEVSGSGLMSTEADLLKCFKLIKRV